ncbi:MAG TPA: Ger(x)C family spore germination protein [Candidatus Egerieicola faecale]|uniref:Ger(X)C family spore germination protein n=1 Tax=Candidatus Egerieicola faecale TaxID=2840774 RepID=A0A9D1IS57_9FIRM|nr:Ger(x)C family spore germination protein [Candidatus Egerieicola faecale]
MKRMISCLLTAVALLPLLLFTGCIQGVQTSELALVEAVGIDRTDDGRLKLTLQIFAPRGSGSATAVDSSKNNSAILTATGDTISQAVEQANQMQGKTMFLGHNRVIVLGQSLVAESIQPILSFFDRSENTRQNARVLVSAVTAEEIVSTGVQQGILSAESLEAMIRQGEESDGALECNYFSLSMQLDDTGGSALIPVIRPLPEEETQSQSQDSSSSGEEGVSMAQLNHFQLEGTALLQNYALTTVFSQEVTKGLCFLLNESDYPVLVLSHEDTTLSARLHQSSSSWSVSGEGAVLSVQAKASIDELLQPGERESENDFTQMEQLAGEEIASLCQSAYREVTAYQANVLDLMDQLKWSDGDAWEAMKEKPEEFLAGLSLQVEVEVTFDRTGLETNQKVGR